mmetsp:Transcript_36895/g.92535  ORF Transcript_36895/g.92535 Transcript_36895/m.92535 type:complete len:341 (-) Transcript_36895:363-1385(-)
MGMGLPVDVADVDPASTHCSRVVWFCALVDEVDIQTLTGSHTELESVEVVSDLDGLLLAAHLDKGAVALTDAPHVHGVAVPLYPPVHVVELITAELHEVAEPQCVVCLDRRSEFDPHPHFARVALVAARQLSESCACFDGRLDDFERHVGGERAIAVLYYGHVDNFGDLGSDVSMEGFWPVPPERRQVVNQHIAVVEVLALPHSLVLLHLLANVAPLSPLRHQIAHIPPSWPVPLPLPVPLAAVTAPPVSVSVPAAAVVPVVPIVPSLPSPIAVIPSVPPTSSPVISALLTAILLLMVARCSPIGAVAATAACQGGVEATLVPTTVAVRGDVTTRGRVAR